MCIIIIRRTLRQLFTPGNNGINAFLIFEGQRTLLFLKLIISFHVIGHAHYEADNYIIWFSLKAFFSNRYYLIPLSLQKSPFYLFQPSLWRFDRDSRCASYKQEQD